MSLRLCGIEGQSERIDGQSRAVALTFRDAAEEGDDVALFKELGALTFATLD